MANVKILSFDMDGTITDLAFVNSVWLEGVPRLFSERNGISFQDALTLVKSEYDKLGVDRLEWYDLDHWARKFSLNVSPKEILNSFQHRIKTFPEVAEVLQTFKDKGFRLIIVSNARREFLDLELKKTGIGHFFERTFSSTSDFRLIKKTTDVYQNVCRACGVFPSEIVHVGDDKRFDFDIPKKLGIKTYYLDRTGGHSGETVVHSLKELVERVAPK
jgi:GMP/IMP 5'-nucleotidase